MRTAKVETCLELFGLLNGGTDHGPDYGLCPLSAEGPIEDALGAHFAALRTSLSPAVPSAQWGIVIRPPAADWKPVVSKAARRWFFEQRFSPKTADAEVETQIVERFTELLREEVGDPIVQEVFVTPPMFYECEWQDFALTSAAGRWLLHFGVSD